MNRRTVQSYAVLWMLGLAFLWWPWALLRSLAEHRPQARRRPVALFLVAGCLAASLLIAVIRGADPSRLVAASANLTVWVTLCLVLARQWGWRDAGEVIRGVVDLAVFQGVLVVLARLIYPTLSGASLPLARLLPESIASEPNVAAFTTVQLAQEGYYGQFVIRAGGIFGNATWTGGFAAVALLMLLFGGKYLGPQMQRPLFRGGAIVLSALTLYWSYARVDVLAFAVAAAAILAIKTRRHAHPSLWLASVLIVLGTTIAVLPALPLAEWFGEANAPRQASLETRVDIYGATLDAVQDSPTPLVGEGIKQRSEGLVASQGTHSSYLGLTYRGGVLCVASFIVFLLALGYRGVHENSELTVGLVFFLLVWCVTDDIDAGNLVALAILVAHGMAAPSEQDDAPEGIDAEEAYPGSAVPARA